VTTIIPFRQKGPSSLPVPSIDPDDIRPVARPMHEIGQAVEAFEGEVERHWGVAIALASWPLCLGASVVLATL
jgi:hypothetical protein